MTADRVDTLLVRLDGDVAPAGEFAEDLFTRLLPAVSRARSVDATPVGAVDRALGRLLPKTATGRVRRLMLLAAVVALAALGVALALTGSRPSPDRLVLMSQAAYDDPPPFEMWIETTDGRELRALFDGDTTFRLEQLTGDPATPGSTVVSWSMTTEATRADWFGTTGTGWILDVPAGVTPLHLLDMNWLPTERRFLEPASDSYVVCPAWFEVGREVVAGRDAVHVSCDGKPTAAGLAHAWIDLESGLLLRSDETMPGTGTANRAAVFASATMLDLTPTFKPGLFTLPTPGGPWGAALHREAGSLPHQRAVTGSAFEPSLAVTPSDDWRGWNESVGIAGLTRGGEPGVEGTSAVWIASVGAVVDQPSGAERSVDRVDELAAWFAEHPWLVSTPPRSTTLASLPALTFEFTPAAPIDVGDRCDDDESRPCWRLFTQDGGGLVMYPDQPARTVAYVVDVRGTLLVVLGVSWGPDFYEDDDEIDRLLASLEFLE